MTQEERRKDEMAELVSRIKVTQMRYGRSNKPINRNGWEF